MLAAPIPANEREPVAALRRYDVLDTAPEPPFDDIVWLAARLCGTPMALVSLVDSERDFFTAVVGSDLR
jgi:hypothetical protein